MRSVELLDLPGRLGAQVEFAFSPYLYGALPQSMMPIFPHRAVRYGSSSVMGMRIPPRRPAICHRSTMAHKPPLIEAGVRAVGGAGMPAGGSSGSKPH
jgi:hypothetical protein